MTYSFGEILTRIGLTLLGSIVYNLIPLFIMLLGCIGAQKGKTWKSYFAGAFIIQAIAFAGLIEHASRVGISPDMQFQSICDGIFFIVSFIALLLYARGKSGKFISDKNSLDSLQSNNRIVSNKPWIKTSDKAVTKKSYVANILDPMGSITSPEGIWRKERIEPRSEEERQRFLRFADKETGELFFLVVYREGKQEHNICKKEIFIEALESMNTSFESTTKNKGAQSDQREHSKSEENEYSHIEHDTTLTQTSKIISEGDKREDKDNEDSINKNREKREEPRVAITTEDGALIWLPLSKAAEYTSKHKNLMSEPSIITSEPDSNCKMRLAASQEESDSQSFGLDEQIVSNLSDQIAKDQSSARDMADCLKKKQSVGSFPGEDSFEQDMEILKLFKQMLEEDLITEEDYSKKKTELLNKIIR